MQRNQVLGESPLASIKPKAGDDNESGSGSAPDETSGGPSGKGSGKAASDDPSVGSFSNAMSGTQSASSTSAPVSSAALVQSATPEERTAVINQISQHIQSLSQPNGPNTMTVTVQPPHWGEVKIAVTMEPAPSAGGASSTLSATVTASTSEVQGALQQHVQDLRDSLTAAGLHVDKLNVAVGTVASASQSGSMSGQHAGQHGAGSDSQSADPRFSGSLGDSGGFGNPSQSASGWATDDRSVTIPQSSNEPDPSSGSDTAPTVGIGNNTRIDVRA
jgi:hypothetical protein